MGDIAIKQGRSAEVDAPAAGTLQVTFNNSLRHFDPDHATGPFYGNLRQRKRIRVSVGGSVLFTGWVQGWPQTLNTMGGTSTVTVQAVDALGMLTLSPLGETPYIAMQMRYAPDLYLRCDDDRRDILLDTSGNDHHAVNNYPPSDLHKGGEAPLPTGQAETLQFTTAAYADYTIPPVYAGVTAKRYQAISAWVRRGAEPASTGGGLFVPGGTPAGPSSFIRVNDNRTVTAGREDVKGILLGITHNGLPFTDYGFSYSNGWTAPNVLVDGLWHHVFLCLDTQAMFGMLWIDGISMGEQSMPPASGTGFFSPYVATSYSLTTPFTVRDLAYGVPAAGVSNVAFMQSDDSDLKYAAAPALYAAATGWKGDTESQRVAHVLDAIGWPDGLRTASYSGGPQPEESELPADALSYLVGMTRRDGSTVLGMKDGSVKFRNRNALTTESRSINTQAAFGDDSGFTYRYSDVLPALDDEYVVNVISAKRKGGSRTFTVRDKASIDTYFNRLLDLGELRAVDDVEVMGFLGWLLRTYSTPRNRLRILVVNGRTDAATLTKVTDLWIGDRISVSFTPLGIGAATVYDQWIEGVEHHIDMSALSWLTSYTTSPARVTITNPFIIGTSELGPIGTDELGH
jgi:hypothetical protein